MCAQYHGHATDKFFIYVVLEPFICPLQPGVKARADAVRVVRVVGRDGKGSTRHVGRLPAALPRRPSR